MDRHRTYNPIEVLIQLALIWVVVYMVLRFLRGTRGARVLKGVGLVLVVAALLVAVLGGENSGFGPLQYLLEITIGFATLALVIVFQPELRRALVRIGEARLFRGNASEVVPLVNEIVRSVEHLAQHRTGAIIAIEREVGLTGVVEAGTSLNADVSAELIQSIFWPGSALHDMGVVIRRAKIIAAGVQFPLAESGDATQDLGSRHRAAIGLSQEADCLVVVVSEETGAISLAERGQLIRNLSIDALRTMLRRGLSYTQNADQAARAIEEDATPPADDEGPDSTDRSAA